LACFRVARVCQRQLGFRVLYCLNELINEHQKFSDCVQKLVVKCNGGGAEKFRRRRDWSVDDFDSIEIRLGKSAKFDGAGVYLLILHMTSAANFLVSPLVGVLCDKEKRC